MTQKVTVECDVCKINMYVSLSETLPIGWFVVQADEYVSCGVATVKSNKRRADVCRSCFEEIFPSCLRNFTARKEASGG